MSKALVASSGPGLQIVYRRLSELFPYARNARKHPESQKVIIRASMLEYGWTNPMLIANDEMVAGHGRLEVALELARAGKVIPRNPHPWSGPTIDLSHLSPVQRRAYVLMDNKSALGSTWDDEMLAMELGSLVEDQVDVALAGFTEDDMQRLLGDFAPPPPKPKGPAGEKLHTCPACGHEWASGGE